MALLPGRHSVGSRGGQMRRLGAHHDARWRGGRADDFHAPQPSGIPGGITRMKMTEKLKLTPVQAMEIAKRYVVENFSYDDYVLHDSRITDELYRFTYKARDFYDREVEIVVTIDLVFRTISADIALLRDKLQQYL